MPRLTKKDYELIGNAIKDIMFDLRDKFDEMQVRSIMSSILCSFNYWLESKDKKFDAQKFQDYINKN